MRIAIFTITQNDPWLPWWAEHARSQGFQKEDIYILDHGSTGTFRDKYLVKLALQHPVIRVRHRYSYDYDWLSETVSSFQRFLSTHYDVVVFTAADELMYPTQRATVVDALREEPSRAVGDYVEAWEVVQQPGEAAYDIHLPWDVQRTRGFRSNYYRRIRVMRKPVILVPPRTAAMTPFGRAYNVAWEQPSLSSVVIAHMHRMDFHRATVRHREIVNNRLLRQYSEESGAPHRHNLITGEEAVINWIGTDPDRPGHKAVMMPLPMLAKESGDGRGFSAGDAEGEGGSSSSSVGWQ